MLLDANIIVLLKLPFWGSREEYLDVVFVVSWWHEYRRKTNTPNLNEDKIMTIKTFHMTINTFHMTMWPYTFSMASLACSRSFLESRNKRTDRSLEVFAWGLNNEQACQKNSSNTDRLHVLLFSWRNTLTIMNDALFTSLLSIARELL